MINSRNLGHEPKTKVQYGLPDLLAGGIKDQGTSLKQTSTLSVKFVFQRARLETSQ